MEKSVEYRKKEFDNIIEEYERYTNSLRDSKNLRRIYWRSFFDGMTRLFDIFGNIPIRTSLEEHPLYSRKDLSPEQKDIVSSAMSFRGVKKDLDKIVCGKKVDEVLTREKANKALIITNKIYSDFRESYALSFSQ